MKKTISPKKKKTAKKSTKKPSAAQIMSALVAHDLWQLSKIHEGMLNDKHILLVCKEFRVNPKIVIEILKRKGVQIILVN